MCKPPPKTAPRSYARTLTGQEHAGARESSALEERERPVRVLERERRRRRANGDPRRLRQELLAVGPRIGGDAPHVPLVEEIALVVERRHRGHVNASERQRAAARQVAERDRHPIAHPREEDRAGPPPG